MQIRQNAALSILAMPAAIVGVEAAAGVVTGLTANTGATVVLDGALDVVAVVAAGNRGAGA